jgi:RNA polymerase sigma-70 factor (ECF subfamily)
MSEARDHPRPETAVAEKAALDGALVAALYTEHGPELHRFILGVVRDPDLANDLMQTTFAKAVEQGHAARAETLKGWLFRVAFHEAITARRRKDTREQAHRRLAALGFRRGERPEDSLIRGETVEAVRNALEELPEAQRRVVRARIYEDKTFAEIAEEDNLPLGTVLTRMRRALEKLRRTLRPGD